MIYKYTSTRLSLLLSIAVSVFISSCSTELTEPKYSDGDADFAKYIAIGGGYSSGYGDHALHLRNQQHSYPAILAERFSKASGGEFIQPLVNAGVGLGLDSNAMSILQISNSICGDPFITPVPADSIGDLSNATWIGAVIRYQNMSVPGAMIADLNKQQFGDPSPFVGNVFYSRFAINPGQSTVIGDALVQSPTFYTLWAGMEDVYSFAVGGGFQSNDSITTVLDFEASLNTITSSFFAISTQGAIATIPTPDNIPYFSVIPWNGLELSESEAQALTQAYAGINPNMVFQEGNNGFVITDNAEPSGIRQLFSGELVLANISIDSINCSGYGATVPFPSRLILDQQELGLINNAINGYNNAIRSTASNNSLALVEMQPVFENIAQGFTFNGATYSNGQIYNSVYSSDGLYPNPRGNALIANAFISAINRKFGAKLPFADINSFPSNNIP